MKVMMNSKHNEGVTPKAKAAPMVCAFVWTMTTRWIFCRVLFRELRVRTARTLRSGVDIPVLQTRKLIAGENLVRILTVSKPTKKAGSWSFLQKNLIRTSRSALAGLQKTLQETHTEKMSPPWMAFRAGPMDASNSIKTRRSVDERTRTMTEMLRWLMLRHQQSRKHTNDALKSNLATSSRRRYVSREDDLYWWTQGHVQKAGGDVKKGKVDPYAYLPLSQAAKRKGRDRIGVAGKR